MRLQKIIMASIFLLSLASSITFFIYRDFFAGAKSLGLLGLFILNFISNASFFISAPTLFTVIAGGSIYPPFLVAIVSSLGAAGGDMIGFVMGISGRKLVIHKFHKKIWFKVLEDYFKKYGSIILFVFALIPNPFFDSVGIIAGAFAFSPLKYFLIVFLGRLIRFFLLALAGKSFF